MCLAAMAHVYAACAVRVSTGGKFGFKFLQSYTFWLKLLVSLLIQQVVTSLAQTIASFSGLHSDNSYQAFAAFTAFTSVIDAAC